MTQKKQNYSPTENKKAAPSDNCPICKANLQIGDMFTEKVGILDTDTNEILGWICPTCKSEFDMDDRVTSIYGLLNMEGEA